MKIVAAGRALRTFATWSGLTVSAAVLAGMVLHTPDPASDSGLQVGEPSAVTERFCGPGESAARVTDPAWDDPGSLTAEEAAEFDRLLQNAVIPQKTPSAQSPVKVPVVFHVISHSDGTGNIAQEVVDEQVRVLNKAFSGSYGGVDTGFRFTLQETTRTTNSEWFTAFFEKEKAIKSKLHQGSAKTLNIYSLKMSQGMLGRASFPQEYRNNPDGDGVAIDYRTVPGGAYTNFNVGHTVTHETGHWLGLFHTFQNGCDNPGDYVWDTPYEREQSIGCPVGRDTCPDRRGLDPVNNYMNYSNDPCLKEFTKGQAERMAMSWSAFRAP